SARAGEPVSVEIRTGLCSRPGIPPRKGLARPEAGRTFLAIMPNSGRQRQPCLASMAAKPRGLKEISAGMGGPAAASLRISDIAEAMAAIRRVLYYATLEEKARRIGAGAQGSPSSHGSHGIPGPLSDGRGGEGGSERKDCEKLR